MTTDPSPVVQATRRQRGRAAALLEIKAAALDELREHGARGVTMRGVARAIDMTPSGLYRYFEDHQALLAALCVDAHESLTATLKGAHATDAHDDPMTQWYRGSVLMRAWALEHPDEYALVVGPRLSGVAPERPELGAAIAGLMQIPVDTVVRAITRGELVPTVLPPSASSADGHGAAITRQARMIATGAVTALVGAVSLETFGHLGGADRAGEYAVYSLQVMRGMGWVNTPEVAGPVLSAS